MPKLSPTQFLKHRESIYKIQRVSARVARDIDAWELMRTLFEQACSEAGIEDTSTLYLMLSYANRQKA